MTQPNPLTGGSLVPSGNMLLRLRTLSALDFTNLYYVVVFNTSGNNQEPYASSLASFTNYSFALVFGGTSVVGASYRLLQVIPSGTSAGFVPRTIPVQTQYVTSFNPNSSGSGNEFTFTFNRQLLNVANPLVSASPSTSPSPSPTPTATATASGATPTPSPTPTAVATATYAPGVSTLWNINFFSTDLNGLPLDSIANLGIQDVSFILTVDTTITYDQVFTKPNPPTISVNNPRAQITQAEVINAP